MFGTIRSIATRAKAAFKKVIAIGNAPTLNRTAQGPMIPLITSRQRAAMALATAMAERGGHPHHYPELQCHNGRKTKGEQDRSKKVRSNRRKASARARKAA